MEYLKHERWVNTGLEKWWLKDVKVSNGFKCNSVFTEAKSRGPGLLLWLCASWLPNAVLYRFGSLAALATPLISVLGLWCLEASLHFKKC